MKSQKNKKTPFDIISDELKGNDDFGSALSNLAFAHQEAIDNESMPDEQLAAINKANTLRQRLARFVRQTLSFSKSAEMHELCLPLFLLRYNLSLISSH